MDTVLRCVIACLPVPAVTRARNLSAADDHDGEDRISALPDELLRDVVSRLPIKNAVRTAALSPRWRAVWRSTPLVLYDVHLVPADEGSRVAAIDRILASHPGPLRTVHLALCLFGAHERELGEWSRRLASGGVQDLVLINQPPPVGMALPADILSCTELRRLYLGFWEFPDTRELPNGAGVFPHLREFVILYTRIVDRDLDHMLASSPSLETLAFVLSCGMPEHVHLSGQKLQCVLFWFSLVFQVAVVDAPSLERLIMWQTSAPGLHEPDGDPRMSLSISYAPELKVLGYLDTRAHKLQIANTVIKADTKVTPSFTVPSVKVLALRVNFSVSTGVQMLATILRCFPNIETLHVESAIADEPTGKHYSEFFEKLGPIECVQSHIKKMVLHNCQCDISEIAFLKFITQRMNQLQKLTIVLSDEELVLVGQDILKTLAIAPWGCEACMVLLVRPIVERGWNFCRASDLSIKDPFLLEHEQEIFHLIKKRE